MNTSPFPNTWDGVVALDTETYGGFGLRMPKAIEWACPYSIFLARFNDHGSVTEQLQIWVNPEPLDEAARVRSVGVTANLCAGRDPDGPVPEGCRHYADATTQQLWCLAHGVGLEVATAQVLDFIGPDPKGYLGSNLKKFDIDTVLRNIGCKVPDAPIYDTRELYGYVADGLKPHNLPINKFGTLDRSLGTIGRILGIDNLAPHTARGDTIECIDVAVTLKRMDSMLRAAWAAPEAGDEATGY